MKAFKQDINLLLITLFLMGFSCTLQAKNDFRQTNTEEHYEKLFNPLTVHTIMIKIKKRELEQMIRDMIAHNERFPVPFANNYRVNKYYKADFIYSGPLGDFKIKEVGFRPKGNYFSRNIPCDLDYKTFYKTHFKIKFNKAFTLKKDTKRYKTRRQRSFATQKELVLRYPKNVGSAIDNTQIKELYVCNLFNRAGIITSRTAKAKFYLIIGTKKIDYGLFNLIENIDKVFLRKRFGRQGNDGNLYKCGWRETQPDMTLRSIQISGAIGIKDWRINYLPGYELKTNKKNTDYGDLKRFIKNLNSLTGNDFIQFIDTAFEVDQFLKSLALGFLIGNPDDYRGTANNFYLYFQKNGKLLYIPTDLDHSLAGWCWDGFLGGVGPASNLRQGWEIIAKADIYRSNIIKFFNLGTEQRPLVTKILEIDKYKQKYSDYLREFITDGGLFCYQDFLSKYELYYPIYHSYIENDISHGDTMKLTYDISRIMEIKEYYQLKIRSVKEQLGLE